MSYELKMPKLGESVPEGTIGKWLKQPGEKVNKYDLLVEVQTDKVNTEIPSPVEGTLMEGKVQEAQTVRVGTLLAVFDTADGEVSTQPSAAAPSSQQAQSSTPQPTAAAPQAPFSPAVAPRQASPPPSPSQPSAAVSRPSAGTATAERPDLSDVRATPAVRKLAAENGIDIGEVDGTGLGGRVSKKDVEDFIAQRQAGQQAAARVVPAAPAAAPTGPPPPAPTPALAGAQLVPLTPM